jgi:putative ABC transport system permease protein
MGHLLQDFRYALRHLGRDKGIAIIAMLTLALGIGANTAIFSLINTVLLRPLPYGDPERLVMIWRPDEEGSTTWIAIPEGESYSREAKTFESVGYYTEVSVNLTGGLEPERVRAAAVTAGAFQALQVPALLGRPVMPADDTPGANSAVLLGYGVWQRRFGGDERIVGQTIQVNGRARTVIGVMPPSFRLPLDYREELPTELWVPLGADPAQANWGDHSYIAFGRLKPGVKPELATAEMDAIRDGWIRAGFQSDQGTNFLHREAIPLQRFLTGGIRNTLLILLGAVGFVLLIACVNVANLLLARANARQHELSLRVALGASRWDLVRQLLAESLLLSAAGAAGGLYLAAWSGRFLVSQLSTSVNTVVLDLPIDGRIIAFTIGLAAFTTLIFGTAPAFRASGAAPMDALKDHSRGTTPARGRLADAFVVAQVALSVVLLVAAGLLVRTFTQLAARPLGFQAAHVTIVTIDARRSSMASTARLATFERARDAVRALSDVDAAALSLITPFTGGFTPPVRISGTAVAVQSRLFGNLITPGWFATFGTPLLSGRDLTDRDRPGAPRVVVVNEMFARTFFPDRSPLGQTLVLYADTSRAMPPMEIVGVIGDAVYSSIRAAVPPTWYAPLAQFDMPEFSIASIRLSVRSRTQSAASSKAMAAAITSVNPELTLTFRPLADQVHAALTQERLTAQLAGFFGGLALLLAGLGLYGVTSYAVSRRRTEIGIRLALGAAPGAVVGWVLARVSLVIGAGIAVGSAISLWASTLVSGLIYGLQPRDPATLLGAAATLALVAAFAAWLPARRAARIDPVEVLREG